MKWKLALAYPPLLSLTLFAPARSICEEPGGLQPGAKSPAFSLFDQAGKKEDLDTLSGPNGLLLLFFRSADWCPFCKGQLVDLEAAQKVFAAKGIGVAAISYDSPAILANFAKRRSITYPLLSDPGSKVIDEFGVRNPQGSGIEAGIPYPGYFLIDRQGTIKRRFFESGCVNRVTANNLYAYLFGNFPLPEATRQVDRTPHVSIATTQSDTDVTPGAVVRLVVTLTPGPDTHVYAPGADKQHYRVTNLTIKASNLYHTSSVSYPESVPMEFPALQETVPVYTGPATITTSAAAVVSEDTIPIFSQNPHLAIKGEIEYQACTSTVCFPPERASLKWDLNLRPLDLERAPEKIQHK